MSTLVDQWLEAAAPPPTLVVVAHPDDETIGAGAQLGRLGALTLVHLTDGAPRDPWFWRAAGVDSRAALAALRAAELDAALARGGVGGERVALGLSDQEAALQLVEVTLALANLLRRVRPAVVLTHPYEGGHPDHDAAAFAVAHAVALAGPPRAAIVEMAFYHDTGGALATGRFLPNGPAATVVPLAAATRARKRAMLDAFASQQAVLARFPLDAEHFRVAPLYDFSQPPHAGTLHYERFGWALTGARFCALAAAAAASAALVNRAAAGGAPRSG